MSTQNQSFLNQEGLSYLWRQVERHGVRGMYKTDYNLLSEEDRKGLIVVYNNLTTSGATWVSPNMTSATEPANYQVAASSYHAIAKAPPWNGVDNNINTFWHAAEPDLTPWYSFNFGEKTIISGIRLRSRTTYITQMPETFILQGSNDEETWTNLMEVTGYSELDGENRRTYMLSAPAKYKIFRLYNMRTNVPGISFSELEFLVLSENLGVKLMYNGLELYLSQNESSIENEFINSYSTEETKIGIWTDKRPLYRKVIFSTTPTSIGNFVYLGKISEETITATSIIASTTDTSGSQISIPFIVQNPGESSPRMVMINLTSDGTGLYGYVTYSGYAGRPLILILEYTKPSDEPVQEIETLSSGVESNPIPSGGIIMWSGTEIPDGWALCNGENGTPDLRGRFVLGSSDTYKIGDVGGEETHSLTIPEMPSHNHTHPVIYGPGTTINTNPIGNVNASTVYVALGMPTSGTGTSTASSKSTTNVGGSNEHNNMPPYYVLAYIMKL